MLFTYKLYLAVTFILLVSNSQSTSDSLINWRTLNVSLPSANVGICGYDSTTKNVFILGGANNPNNLIHFNTVNHQLTQYPSINISIYDSFGQRYVHYNNDIYFLKNYKIGKFNMNTQLLQYPLFNQSSNVEGRRSCLSISNDGRYLFVLGGSSGVKVAQFQIYHFENGVWFNGPDMIEIRSALSCYSINGYLYAIGGDHCCTSLSSVEKIDIKNISNITSKSWSYISSNLTEKKNLLRTIAFNDNLYMIGGRGAGMVVFDTVDRMYTDVIDSDNSLPTNLAAVCAIRTSSRIYVFGGENATDWTQNIYWTELEIPTEEPSENPTYDPSKYPSYNPSTIPTYNPSKYPSYNPSTIPTYNPSKYPSYNPSTTPTDMLSTSTKLTTECEVIALNITIQSHNDSLY
eukprot:364069_1